MLYVLLAAYNEEGDLAGLLEDYLKQAWQWPFKIIFVDDGSTDKTKQIAEGFGKKLPTEIIIHEKNKGLGKALKTGFTKISQIIQDNDIVITMDADWTHPVEIIPSMKEKIENGADIVIASRFRKGGTQSGLSKLRRVLSIGASTLLGTLCSIKNVRDYTSGYRAFSGKLLKKTFDKYGSNFICETGFTATLEILLKSSVLTKNIEEVPLNLHYEKKAGSSKMKIIRTIFRYLILIFRNIRI